MAVYRWLDKIQHQFKFVGSEGAFAELEFEQPKETYVRCSEANNDYFLLVPQVLRRCFFLTPHERSVLWELMSWMDEDGFCKVSLKTLSMYTGLTEKTVSKMLNGLVQKSIIMRKHTNSTDMFLMQDLSKNPYVLISEAVHSWIKFYIRQTQPKENRARKLENLFSYNIPASFDLARKHALQFVNTAHLHEPFIKKLMKDGNFKELYKETIDELDKLLSDSFNEKVQ